MTKSEYTKQMKKIISDRAKIIRSEKNMILESQGYYIHGVTEEDFREAIIEAFSGCFYNLLQSNKANTANTANQHKAGG